MSIAITTLIVLGFLFSVGCCCDGVCLDCNADDIEALTITVTISGVTGNENAFVCSPPGAVTCTSLWNAAFVLSYYSGAGTSGCVFSYDDGSNLSCYQRAAYITFVSSGTVNTVTVSLGVPVTPIAVFETTFDPLLTCDFDEDIAFSGYGGATTDCDFSGANANIADV